MASYSDSSFFSSFSGESGEADNCSKDSTTTTTGDSTTITIFSSSSSSSSSCSSSDRNSTSESIDPSTRRCSSNEPSPLNHSSSYYHCLINASRSRLSWRRGLLHKFQRALAWHNASCKASVCENSTIYRYRSSLTLESGKERRVQKDPKKNMSSAGEDGKEGHRRRGFLPPVCEAKKMGESAVDGGILMRKLAWERKRSHHIPSSMKHHHHKTKEGIHGDESGEITDHPHAPPAMAAIPSWSSPTRSSPNQRRSLLATDDPKSLHDASSVNGCMQELHHAVQSAIAHCKASNSAYS